ncbi:MAG: hypothetical protein WA239_02645, partial [Candidatus Sulfotelmatobacter sp.]
MIALILVSVIFWAAPVTPEDVAITWIFRIVLPAGATMLLMRLLSTPKDTSLRQMRATVQPATDTVCPFC